MSSTLNKAREAKKDEFYTQSSDIENEIKHYRSHFKGKKVFCNCDDPKESNFFQFFAQNFEFLGLEKLTTTHYRDDKPTYKLVVDRQLDVNKDGKINADDAVKYTLSQNGDFRSEESIAILEEADIVVTNPPFSLFREYMSQLIEYKKKFLIIGNNNAIALIDTFKLIREGQIWLGTSSNKTMEYRVPEHYNAQRVDDSGRKYVKVPAISWFTNMDHKKRSENIILYKEYNKEDYPTYDNYDAIEVSKVADIPVDYNGIMGVPIAFLGKHNPHQFEIRGLIAGAGYNADKVRIPLLNGRNGMAIVDGKPKYNRILIKKK